MPQFLDTHAIASEIGKIITKAEKFIVLISPYINFPRILLERLKDADSRNVLIIIVYGKTKLHQKELSQFNTLKNISLSYLENLHAKCYFNEETAIISSMNLYEFSEKNNREMGILIKRKKETETFNEIVLEFQSIIKASELILERTNKPASTNNQDTNDQHQKSNNTGHCIRCNSNIYFDPLAPFCKGCYFIWAEYKNRNYRENYCHFCGNQANTSMDYPACNRC